jgi:hypothetical protein
MAFAQGSRSLVSYQEETTWGVNPAGTAGSQQVSFTSGKAGGDPTGLLNDETVYDATIAVDGGGAQAINVVGEEAQTFTQLIAEINQDLTGASIALEGGNLVVTSDTLGTSSSIAITDTDLFSTLTNFSAVDAAVAGTGSGAANFTSLPYTSFAINLTKDAFQDDTIRSDRRRQFNIHGNRIVGGDISVNLAANAFDDWIASALYSDWSTNVISDGVTEKSFTVEQGQLDISQYSLYTGVKVNTWNVDVPVDGIVTSTFSVQGKDFAISGTTIDGTVTDPTISEPFFHAGGTFTIDGVESCISAVSLSVDNGGTANYCLGDDSANNITVGLISVTGSLTVYFEDASIFTNFLNEATAVLDFTLTDGVNSLNFNLPKIKYNGADRTVDGQGPILVTAAFEALSNAGGPVITITRS